MRFSNPENTRTPSVGYARNLYAAHVLAGRIHLRTESLSALPFYRALYDYRKLDSLTRPLERPVFKGSSVKHKTDLIFSFDREIVLRLKKDVAFNLHNCLRDDQTQKLESAAKFLWGVYPLRPISKFLQKAVDAYADAKQTDWERGKRAEAPIALKEEGYD